MKKLALTALILSLSPVISNAMGTSKKLDASSIELIQALGAKDQNGKVVADSLLDALQAGNTVKSILMVSTPIPGTNNLSYTIETEQCDSQARCMGGATLEISEHQVVYPGAVKSYSTKLTRKR